MTARAGSFYNVQPSAPSAAAGLRGRSGGAFYSQQVNTGIFKNQGWYSTGSVFEVWISYGTPSIAPPSGHTLTQIHHVRLDTPS